MGLGRIDDTTGVVDGSNRWFYVPNPYVPGTLVVMLNGRQLDRDLENGWVETAPATGGFYMKIPPRGPGDAADDPGDLVSAYYENAEEVVGGGAGGGVPEMTEGEDVRPRLCSSEDLAPERPITDVEDDDVPTLGASVLVPDAVSAAEYVPRMVKAEEV